MTTSKQAPELRVHPSADIFPMIAQDELQELANSIAANGLRYPIVLVKDSDGDVLIDGRNRLKACELAGIKPTFTYFEGDNDAILAYIADVNIARRQLKKSQQAIAYAMLYPKALHGGKRKKGSSSVTELEPFCKASLSSARAVLAHSATLADDVLNDRLGLDKALGQVKQEKLISEMRAAQINQLREEAPDLAERVSEEVLNLEDAVAANEQRKKVKQSEEEKRRKEQEIILREQREAICKTAYQIINNTPAWANAAFVAATEIDLHDDKFRADFLRITRAENIELLEIIEGAKNLVKVLQQLMKD